MSNFKFKTPRNIIYQIFYIERQKLQLFEE